MKIITEYLYQISKASKTILWYKNYCRLPTYCFLKI